MPIDRLNTITLHLNDGDNQWAPSGSVGWDTRFAEGCEDSTRERSIPIEDELGELPWSARSLPPGTPRDTLTQMTGVRFQPLDGLITPDFLVPYYDWGVVAVVFGQNNDPGRLGNVGPYLELLFDTPEARQSFIDVFGTEVRITRTGSDRTDPANPILINEFSDYTITRTDSEITQGSDVWGTNTYYPLSWREPDPVFPAPNPPQVFAIKNTVDERLIQSISTIIDIEFTNPGEDEGGIDIMGSCDPQSIDPCKPIVPPECESDADCLSCNSRCVSGTCICEDCPCNSVCLDVEAALNDETLAPAFVPADPRPLIDGDQENCTNCVHPLFGNIWCSCQPVTSQTAPCRPERGNCDCPPDVDQTYVCCEDGNPASVNFGDFTCCGTQEFGTFGIGEAVLQCIPGYGCTTTQCALDSHCPECEFCDLDDNGVGTCTPKENETPCGTDGLNCTWCQNGECVDNPSTVNCNCPGQECDPGFDCCSGGFCCPSEFGCGSGSGCDQCDTDGDCPECETCQQLPGGNRCTVTDCDPCFTREPPDCECIIPVCRNCESCFEGNCTENCPVCSGCGPDGECTPVPQCPPDQFLNTSTCECEDRCLDCEIWNGTECVIDDNLCGCCTACIEVSGFNVCSGPDSTACPAGDVCVADSTTGTCSCVTPGCDPPCETIGGGCMECLIFGSTGICVPPQLHVPPLPDACNDTCEECQNTGNCGNSTCDGDCCADGSCCSAGNKCCEDGGGSFYCCAVDEVCCGDGTCCPNGQICCNGSCCDPGACQSCVDGACVVCAGTPCGSCVNGSCQGGCQECENCINGKCEPDPNRTCDPLCPFDWCDANNCTPDPSCVDECQCSGSGNDPCTCSTGAPIFAIMECDCGDDSGGGGEERGACCLFGNCTFVTPTECRNNGGNPVGGPCLPNPCFGPGAG